MNEWTFWGCALFLAAAFATDIRSMRIPNWISVSALLTGLSVQAVMAGWQGLIFAGAGAAGGFIILLLMHMIGAVGAGDVKLFAGVGAWTGLLFTTQVIIYSTLFAAIIGFVIVVRRREGFTRFRRTASRLAGFIALRNPKILRGGESEMLRFPFMLAVVPGFLCAYLYL
ncbi:prepilin peptidase [Paenibacillus sp. sgz500958]|uniref:A24 family peptidase n=1 Tax=Paenibacillus sp. sgz500958 TaxID=3242475 RepID=UPI0036D41C12